MRSGLKLSAAACSLLPVAAFAQSLYVAPAGTGDGQSRDRPAAIERVATLGPATTVYVLPGLYRLSKAILIDGGARGVTWRPLRPGTAILDGGGRTDMAMVVSGSAVTVAGLSLRHFTADGIRVQNSFGARIVGNTIEDITSTRWSQGAIHGLSTAPGSLVEGNTIRRAGYAGVIFDANRAGDLSNVTIRRNLIQDVCREKSDCGAIYINGRTAKSRSALIEGNRIRGFGPAANETKAIYLDDGLSGALVTGNRIAGQGSYAFQIHGGSGNRIERNNVAVAGGFLLYQNAANIAPMEGNIVTGNLTNTLTSRAASGAAMIDLSGNVLSATRR